MSTEQATPPAPPPAKQPDWMLIVLFALLVGAALYALYYALSSQASVNRYLVAQNKNLAGKVAALEAAQNDTAKASLITGMQQTLAGNRRTIAALESRLATVEKTASAPAPVVEFTAPAAGPKETLQQFVALKTAMGDGKPFARELAAAKVLPEVASIEERLQPFAAEGVATDSTLRDELADWLEAHPATVTTDDPEFATLNTKLKGLFSIRRKQKAATDAYADLRAQVEVEASLDLLITSARDLDDEARAPLDPWLKKAAARQSALTAIRAAEMALAKPAH